jgi:hypothetical protein
MEFRDKRKDSVQTGNEPNKNENLWNRNHTLNQYCDQLHSDTITSILENPQNTGTVLTTSYGGDFALWRYEDYTPICDIVHVDNVNYKQDSHTQSVNIPIMNASWSSDGLRYWTGSIHNSSFLFLFFVNDMFSNFRVAFVSYNRNRDLTICYDFEYWNSFISIWDFSISTKHFVSNNFDKHFLSDLIYVLSSFCTLEKPILIHKIFGTFESHCEWTNTNYLITTRNYPKRMHSSQNPSRSSSSSNKKTDDHQTLVVDNFCNVTHSPCDDEVPCVVVYSPNDAKEVHQTIYLPGKPITSMIMDKTLKRFRLNLKLFNFYLFSHTFIHIFYLWCLSL